MALNSTDILLLTLGILQDLKPLLLIGINNLDDIVQREVLELGMIQDGRDLDISVRADRDPLRDGVVSQEP